MRYTEIVVYKRLGRLIRPMRITRAHGYESRTPLQMSDLFQGHTRWVAEQIERRSTRVMSESQYNAKRKAA